MSETVVPGWWTTGQEARARGGGAGEPVSVGAIGIPLSRCGLEADEIRPRAGAVSKSAIGGCGASGAVCRSREGEWDGRSGSQAIHHERLRKALRPVRSRAIRRGGSEGRPSSALHSRAGSSPAARPSLLASSAFAWDLIIGAGGERASANAGADGAPENQRSDPDDNVVAFPARPRRSRWASASFAGLGGLARRTPRPTRRVRGALTRLEFASV